MYELLFKINVGINIHYSWNFNRFNFYILQLQLANILEGSKSLAFVFDE